MLGHPLNEDEFSFSKWQNPSTITVESMDSQPFSLSLSQLGSRPFDLTNAIVTPPDSSQKSKYPPISSQLDEQQLDTPTSTTDDDQSMTDTNDFMATSISDYMNYPDPNMEDDDAWTTIAGASDSSNKLAQQTRLLSWDDDNDIEEDKTAESCSPYLTEYSGYVEAFYETKFPGTLVIENSRLIKDVIYLLTGVPSLCFEWKNAKRIFQVRRTGMRLAHLSPGVIQHILQPMLAFGTRMKILEDFVAYIQSHPDQFGLIAVSFACCLGELVSYLQHSIVSLFTPSDDHQPQLLEIHHCMEGFYFILRHLADLCTTKTSRGQQWMIPRGGELLTLVYNKALDLDDFHMGNAVFLKAIYTTLLINASTPWLTMLTRWINDGVIEDPYGDFFIVCNEYDQQKPQVSIDKSALPCFLPKDYAKMVLHAGMAMRQQKINRLVLEEFRLSWLVSSWSSNLQQFIHQHISADATTYPLNSPATLSTLPDTDTRLQQEQQSVYILGDCMTSQGSQYTPPLPILLSQRLLDPIQQRYQLTSSLSATPSITSSSSPKSMEGCNMLFTYWNGHSDQYPTTFYTNLATSPFKISTFLHQQRQHHTALATPSSSSSSSSSSNSINQ